MLNISLSEVKFPIVTLGYIIIKPSLKVKSLGFIIDNKLSFKPQISNICKHDNMSLYKIKVIRIDYANSLYCNLPNYRLNKLNMIICSSVIIINNLNIYFQAPIRKSDII